MFDSADSILPPETFKPVPKTGVIYVVSRAAERGFRYGSPDWANFGQGAPEAGDIPGSPPRITHIDFGESQQEYAPVAGLYELRSAVADRYNRTYRKNKKSLYGPQNVAICSGGRLALTRIAASLGDVNIGHFLPDYTAYEELLNSFKSFHPIPILLDEKSDYAISVEELEKEIVGRGLAALLLSNPCNPTGRHIRGDELREWVSVCRRNSCTAIFDEFYSHYTYDFDSPETDHCVSAAQFVDDVESDPVLIVDGLTKNWRYPGWRISWTVGPSAIIEKVASAGSYLDGGASHPLQNAAVDLLHSGNCSRETSAIRSHFTSKRDFMIRSLESMGIAVPVKPQGTFYCWTDVSGLSRGLNTGFDFFEAALKRNVIVVPGVFFDINPGKRRTNRSRYEKHVRISFGPATDVLESGLERLAAMIREAT